MSGPPVHRVTGLDLWELRCPELRPADAARGLPGPGSRPKAGEKAPASWVRVEPGVASGPCQARAALAAPRLESPVSGCRYSILATTIAQNSVLRVAQFVVYPT